MSAADAMNEMVRAKGISRKNARETHTDDVLRVMREPSGRRLMYSLIRGTGFWDDVYDHDERIMSARAARRSIGVQMWSELGKLCPNERRLMIEEAFNLEEAKHE